MAKWTKGDDEALRPAIGIGAAALCTRMNRLGRYADRLISKQNDTFATQAPDI